MDKMARFRVDADNCPRCGVTLNAADSMSGLPPDVGCLTICFNCSAFLIFGEGLKLRLATNEEMGSANIGELVLAMLTLLIERGRG